MVKVAASEGGEMWGPQRANVKRLKATREGEVEKGKDKNQFRVPEIREILSGKTSHRDEILALNQT